MIVVGYDLDRKYNFKEKIRNWMEIIQPIFVILLLGSASSVYLIYIVTGSLSDAHFHRSKINKERDNLTESFRPSGDSLKRNFQISGKEHECTSRRQNSLFKS